MTVVITQVSYQWQSWQVSEREKEKSTHHEKGFIFNSISKATIDVPPAVMKRGIDSTQPRRVNNLSQLILSLSMPMRLFNPITQQLFDHFLHFFLFFNSYNFHSNVLYDIINLKNKNKRWNKTKNTKLAFI